MAHYDYVRVFVIKHWMNIQDIEIKPDFWALDCEHFRHHTIKYHTV